MFNISQEFKDLMIDKGAWGDFVGAMEYAKEHGRKGAAAAYEACLKVSPGDAKRFFGGLPGTSDESLRRRARKDAESIAERERKVSGGERVQFSDRVDRRVFMGKRCSKAAAVEWAYVNSVYDDVPPEDAPSEFAWVLRDDFRKFQAFKVDMMKAVVGKAVAKEDGESVGSVGSIDGQFEFDILRKLSGDETQS